MLLVGAVRPPLPFMFQERRGDVCVVCACALHCQDPVKKVNLAPEVSNVRVTDASTLLLKRPHHTPAARLWRLWRLLSKLLAAPPAS
jgi:hypothetical protein